jgi:hypothetical protein
MRILRLIALFTLAIAAMAQTATAPAPIPMGATSKKTLQAAYTAYQGGPVAALQAAQTALQAAQRHLQAQCVIAQSNDGLTAGDYSCNFAAGTYIKYAPRPVGPPVPSVAH